jgi:hypothetical protein
MRAGFAIPHPAALYNNRPARMQQIFYKFTLCASYAHFSARRAGMKLRGECLYCRKNQKTRAGAF